MRIGVELGQIIPGACGGIVPLLQGALQALFANHLDCGCDLFCIEANAGLFPAPPPHVRLDVLPGEDFFGRVDDLALQRRLDVLVRSYPWGAATAYPACRQVWLVPDMQHEFFPEFFDAAVLKQRRAAFDRALAEAGAIATLSEHARGTILAHPATRCRDVFLMSPALLEAAGPTASLTDGERALLPAGDFFFFPGNLWPHKNHRRTLQALELLLGRVDRPVELVLTGHPEGWPGLAAQFPGLPVRHLGFVSRPLLRELMRRARALVFFSLFEGFGIPLLEAFEAGTPVVCSNTTSLPEVGGDAVLSCGPTDVRAMSELLERVLTEDSLRQRLAARGRERLGLYSYRRSADSLLEACRRVAGRAPELPPPRRALLPGLKRQARARLKRALGACRSLLLRPGALLRRAFAPTLGAHHQYPPRPLVPPPPFRLRLPGRPPVISIVTPSFNQAAFLERTMRSVLEQGYPALEYIVQDGGSTDGTPALLERYRDRLTHCESRKDRGQGNAINLGFRHAGGEVMAYLNSDDLLLPGALAYVAHYFHAHPDVDVIYGHRIVIDHEGREVGRWVLPPHDDEVLSWNDYVPQETLFWRRRAWERVGGIDEAFQFALDWDLLLRFRDAGARIRRVPRFLGAFRVHPLQKTSAHMAEVGCPEIHRLRARSLGRPVTEAEVRRFVRPYLRKHVWYQLLHRAGAYC